MKSIIKNITALMIVVISFTSADFVNANSVMADSLQTIPIEKSVDADRMEDILLFGLESGVDGIIEATLYNAIAYKTMNPDFSPVNVLAKVAELSQSEYSHIVRYKAILTFSYLKDYNEYSDSIVQLRGYVESNDAMSAFELIVENIQYRQQLAAN